MEQIKHQKNAYINRLRQHAIKSKAPLKIFTWYKDWKYTLQYSHNMSITQKEGNAESTDIDRQSHGTKLKSRYTLKNVYEYIRYSFNNLIQIMKTTY